VLLRTKNALRECQEHLARTSTDGSIIESYLTQHILVVLSADMQQAIYELLDKKAQQVQQESIRLFVSAAGQALLRSVRKSAISGFVAKFGEAAKDIFDSNLLDKDQEITRYSNAIKNRDSVAHKQGVQITFGELEGAVAAGELLLLAVDRALKLSEV